jgi:hypothetical protein
LNDLCKLGCTDGCVPPSRPSVGPSSVLRLDPPPPIQRGSSPGREDFRQRPGRRSKNVTESSNHRSRHSCVPAKRCVDPRSRSPIAQLVEQATVNRFVAGSSPARGANLSSRLGCTLDESARAVEPVLGSGPASLQPLVRRLRRVRHVAMFSVKPALFRRRAYRTYPRTTNPTGLGGRRGSSRGAASIRSVGRGSRSRPPPAGASRACARTARGRGRRRSPRPAGRGPRARRHARSSGRSNTSRGP